MHRYIAYPKDHRCDVQDKAVVISLWSCRPMTSVSKSFDISYHFRCFDTYTPRLGLEDMTRNMAVPLHFDVCLGHNRIRIECLKGSCLISGVFVSLIGCAFHMAVILRGLLTGT